MPAPEHLVPILTQLGDGGTVDMAETVHRLILDANAKAVAEALAQVGSNTRPHPAVVQALATAVDSMGMLTETGPYTRGRDIPDDPSDVDPEDAEPWVPITPTCYSCHQPLEYPGCCPGPDGAGHPHSPGVEAADPVIDWGDDKEPVETPAPAPTSAVVRAWCLANGVPVVTKGAIKADAQAAYDAAHKDA